MTFQSDFQTFAIAYALLVIAFFWFHRKTRRQGQMLVITLCVFAAFVVASWNLLERAKKNAANNISAGMHAYAQAYAREMEFLGHSSIPTEGTAPDDPHYLRLIETEKRWLRSNPFIADVYTFRLDPDGKPVLFVDSETDYDRNGVYEGETEARTEIGEPYEWEPQLEASFRGVPTGLSDPYTDRWGTWVSAMEPLRDPDGHIEGVLGIDFNADSYLTAIADAERETLAWLNLVGFLVFGSILSITILRSRIASKEENEQRLSAENARVQAADEAKSQFLANMSHEIRTPLNGILGMSQVLLENEPPQEVRRGLRTILDSAHSLRTILNDILDVSKIEAQKLDLEIIPFEIRSCIESVVALFEQNCRAKKLELVSHISERTPGWVSGDPTRIRQIVSNLLNNAIKFTATGSVSVEVDSKIHGDARLELMITISDSGIGIPHEKLPNLFHRFSQVDASNTRTYGGTGLGLFLSRELARRMNGDIDVESTVGVGSKFVVRVVVGTADQKSIVKAASNSRSPLALDVLLAEDNTVNQMVATKMLERLGCRVTVAHNGQEAVDRVATKSFDVILMDCQMPILDGYAAARKIRDSLGERSPPIVAMTASALAGDRERCLESGMTHFLSKPAQLDDIYRELLTIRTSRTPEKPRMRHPNANVILAEIAKITEAARAQNPGNEPPDANRAQTPSSAPESHR